MFLQLADLLPASAVCREMWIPGDPDALLPAERTCAAGFSEPRLREFAAGRSCARSALEELGMPRSPLLTGRDREPLWPPGFTGSITHTGNYCAAAVCRIGDILSLGIDAERIGEVERSVWRAVFCPAEISWLESLPVPAQDTQAGAVFSAKEAYFKCQFPLTRRWLEFTDVQLRFSGKAFDVLTRNTDARFRISGLHGVIAAAGIVVTTATATLSQ
jgi:4'-phosphopantetheinyl transferase EntD